MYKGVVYEIRLLVAILGIFKTKNSSFSSWDFFFALQCFFGQFIGSSIKLMVLCMSWATKHPTSIKEGLWKNIITHCISKAKSSWVILSWFFSRFSLLFIVYSFPFNLRIKFESFLFINGFFKNLLYDFWKFAWLCSNHLSAPFTHQGLFNDCKLTLTIPLKFRFLKFHWIFNNKNTQNSITFALPKTSIDYFS
jgi:hypothetical protein